MHRQMNKWFQIDQMSGAYVLSFHIELVSSDGMVPHRVFKDGAMYHNTNSDEVVGSKLGLDDFSIFF